MKATFVFLLFISKTFSQDCSIDVSDPEAPFIVNDTLKFAKYDVDQTGIFNFSGERLFYVVCPRGTQSPLIGETGDHVACKGGTNVLNIRNVETIDFAEIKCKPYGLTSVTKSEEKCANNGVLFDIGLTVYKTFNSIITICFNEEKLTPFYSKYNNLFYDNSKRSLPRSLETEENLYQELVCNGTDCGWIDSGSMYLDINMDGIYDKQEEILKNLGVGDVGYQLLKFSLTTNNILSTNDEHKGQRIKKAAYYDYINVVPVWNIGDSVNNLITLFKAFASNDDDTGEITYTGTLGVLTLPNENEEQVEIYLNDGQVPVPKWLWMVLDESEQVVFYHNHPNPDEKAITEVCSEYDSLSANIFNCSYNFVTDLEMKEFLDNDL